MRGQPSGDRLTDVLLAAGALAAPVFLGTASVEAGNRPDYDWRRHPVSSLALGPRGAVQVANFVTSGLLLLGGTVGVARRGGTGLTVGIMGAAAAGLLGAARFRTDPVSGYPPGTPQVADPQRRPAACTTSWRCRSSSACPSPS